MTPTAIGIIEKPAWIGLWPQTNCRYWVRANIVPTRAK